MYSRRQATPTPVGSSAIGSTYLATAGLFSALLSFFFFALAAASAQGTAATVQGTHKNWCLLLAGPRHTVANRQPQPQACGRQPDPGANPDLATSHSLSYGLWLAATFSTTQPPLPRTQVRAQAVRRWPQKSSGRLHWQKRMVKGRGK